MSEVVFEMFLGQPAPPAVVVPPTELPGVPTDDLVLWLDAGIDDTPSNLAVGQTFTAELGSTAGTDSQDPTITTAASVAVWDPDGTDDHIDSDFTPSFTGSTGQLSMVLIGVWDAADAAATFPRGLSAESANSNGINITYGDAGNSELWTTIGGATTIAFRRFVAADGLSLVDGERFMVASVYDNGELQIYTPGLGLSNVIDTTGIGTVTPAHVRAFRPSADAVSSRASTSPGQAILIYNGTLSLAELNQIATAYGFTVTGGGGTGGGGGTPAFRTQQNLATSGSPDHVLTALGYTDTAAITRADLDDILDDWVTGTGGTTRNVTSQASWNTAIAAAVAGDLIRVTSSFTVGSGQLSARGNLYGLSGSTMTASPAGGTAGNPIIITCSDGVEVTGSGYTNNVPVLDLVNCRHVWAVGFNVAGTSQFGIRAMNWGGTEANPAYRAYCQVDEIRDAAIPAQGWFQLISSSGGTPPSGSGNEWGFSEWFVDEMNTVFDPNPTDVTGNPGEGHYYGRGASPGWVSYAKDYWSRGNTVSNYKGNGYESKPGCRRGRMVDNIAYAGRGQNGAPFEMCYQFSGLDDRPSYMDDIDGSGNGDIQIWCESNRVYDYNITETGTTRNQMFILGMAGVRIGNNLAWSARDSSGNAGSGDNLYGVLIQSEKDVADFGNTSTQETFIANNNFQARKVSNLGAADGSITGVISRNNITPSGYGGEFTAGSSDYSASTPSPGVLSTAEWDSQGPGSAFHLDDTSGLVGTGDSVSDLTFAIPADIFSQTIPSTDPNPGPFQTTT